MTQAWRLIPSCSLHAQLASGQITKGEEYPIAIKDAALAALRSSLPSRPRFCLSADDETGQKSGVTADSLLG